MANKKKKENNGINFIETIASGAAIVGLSAAVLGGGNTSRLSTAINKFSHAISRSAAQLSAEGAQNININSTKRAFNRFKKEFSDFTPSTFLRFEDSGVAKTLFARKKAGESIERLFDQEAINAGVSEMQYMFTHGLDDQIAELRRIAINKVAKEAYSAPSLKQSGIADFKSVARRQLTDKNLFGKDEAAYIIDEALKMASALKNKGVENTYSGGLSNFNKALQNATNIQKKLKETERLREALGDYDVVEKLYGSAKKPTKRQTFVDNILGDRQATLGEIIDQYESDAFKDEHTEFMDSVVAEAKELIGKEGGEKWRDIYWDGSIRINKDGQLYTTDAINSALKKADEFYNQTILAKVLKTEEFAAKKTAPFSVSYVGSHNAIIEKMATGSDREISSQSYLFVHGKAYSFKDGTLHRLNDLDDKFTVADSKSMSMRGYRKMFGIDAQTHETRTGLDFNKSVQMNPLESLLSRITKFGDEKYGRNIADKALDNNIKITSNNYEEYFTAYSDLNKILLSSDRTLSQGTAKRISDSLRNRDASSASVFELLSLNDDDLINELLTIQNGSSKYHHLNPPAGTKASKLTMFQEALKQMQASPNTFVANRHIIDGAIDITGESKSYSAAEYMRALLSDEAMLRLNNNGQVDNPIDFLHNVITSGAEAKKATNAFYSAQYINKFHSLDTIEGRGRRTSDLLMQITSDMNRFINSEGKKSQQKEAIRETVNNTISLLQKGFNSKEYYTSQYTDSVYIPKGINPLDILRDLNDNTKNAGETAKSFAKQFIAGFNSKENITSATYAPFFFANRLVSGLESISLGFSQNAYSSTGNLALNIMLKRIAPLVGGIVGLSYLNYEMENLTGMSGSEAFVSGIGNVDLAFRKFTDITGLTNTLRGASISNPLLSYWSNEQEYQSYEERKDWYENGYSPVRQGRFWSFGSASEFRGGKISYWQPSYVRRISSDYYNVSVYGSSEEKWKHSIIPTPRHPFSTLRYLADPYWLEKKHYEDRPYPMTGKMFDETTPWGIVLNPTVGALIKPQRRMHQLELQGTTVDARALIRKRNEEAKNKGEQYYIGIGRNAVHSVEPLPGTNMSPDYNVYYNDSNTAYYSPIVDGGPGGGSGRTGFGGYGKSVSNIPGPVEDISILDKIQISSGSNPFAFAATNILPMEQISQINNSIKQRGAEGYSVRSGYDPSRFTQASGAIYSDAIQYDPTKESFDKDAYMDNRSTEQWLRDVSYSAKELSGIYGFALDMIMPPSIKYIDAHAGAMTSFSSRFWDESIGGTGGSFMEIARRFFPHEDHSVKRINNIRNTMPDWIPEKFQYGDPYSALPKGDMRFPGAGYEALNDLHSDEFGDYGSFDRFKILADIAPWSQEYKQWRQIARETITDPKLIKEMDEIEERAQKQSSRHTFYNKNYGISTKDISGTVSEVYENAFKLHGSEKLYSVAGADLNGAPLYDYLSAGTEVRLTIDKGDRNDDITSAIVYTGGYDNLGKQLVDQGVADSVRENPIDVQAHSNGYNILNAMTETIAHAPIPFIHNKFMKINTPMEAWEEEELYGTSYSTWNHPIEGFIKPAVRKTMAMSMPAVAANVGLFSLSKYLDSHDLSSIIKNSDAEKLIKTAAKAGYAFTNPMSFAGGMTAFMSTFNTKNIAKGIEIGEALGLATILWEKSDNPLIATAGGAAIGATYGAKFFESTSKYGALVGATIGLAVSALRNPGFDLNNWKDIYIPEEAEERWELQEYFDRLKYIKYTGLYQKAAEEAKDKEGVDIEKIINRIEYNQKENDKLADKLMKQQAKLASNDMLTSSQKDYLNYTIQEKLNEIYNTDDDIVIEGGEYTKAAIAYKQAAESTIYGLQEDATMAQILRALPKNHRDFFIEFGEEDDPKKRVEIRSKVSSYEQKVLDIMWGEKPRRQESNDQFFQSHYLPGTFWAGWRPNVSLDNIQIKTIENEGMMLSDFGFYESNATDYEVMMSPSIENYDQANSPAATRASLIASLNGFGLFNVDVSLTPTSKPGIEMFSELTRITDYEIKNTINKAFGGRMLY